MKDILLRHGDICIECELEGTKLTYTFGDDPKRHLVSTLKTENSYNRMKRELNELYESYEDKDEGYFDVCETMETVDFHNRYFTGESYMYNDLRSRDEIGNYLREAEDKAWLMCCCDIANRKPKHGASTTAMNRILNAYDDIPKEGYDAWNCGYWNGIMGALRWILGDEKNYLDT